MILQTSGWMSLLGASSGLNSPVKSLSYATCNKWKDINLITVGTEEVVIETDITVGGRRWGPIIRQGFIKLGLPLTPVYVSGPVVPRAFVTSVDRDNLHLLGNDNQNNVIFILELKILPRLDCLNRYLSARSQSLSWSFALREPSSSSISKFLCQSSSWVGWGRSLVSLGL